MNDFLRNWKPKEEVNGGLQLFLYYGFGNPTKTNVYCSEGGTLYISQYDNSDDVQHISITRPELYDIVYNYMNTEELVKIIEERKKANKI
jgi:hypothetical protein